MRVLGIDCGTEKTDYGVIDSDGHGHFLIASGIIRTSPRQPLLFRLREIGDGLRRVIDEFHPTHAAVEGVFHAVNVKSALVLAHARGVALYVVAEAGISFGEYSALEIKTSVVGYGRAEKQQVQFMVQSILKLPEKLAEDASDAVAVAICHATQVAQQARLEAVR
jgi:crossover junction endodeoxyribonuclease RuvC